MAKGKIVRLGKYRINFSGRGIATKNDETGVVRKYPFPWVKSQAAPENQVAPEGEPVYNEEEEYGEEESAGYVAYDSPDEEGYEGQEGGEYYEPEEEYEQGSGIARSSWLMWLLLIVLPPLGIWLLWKRNRYDITVRSAISAAATIWCVVLLIWLFSGLGNRSDVTTPPTASNAPLTFNATPTPSPTPDPGSAIVPGQATANTGTSASFIGTVNTGANGGSATASTAPAATPNTGDGAGGTVTTQQPTASPTPAPATTLPSVVWATPTGKYFHVDPTCSDMKNAQSVAISVCLNRNQKPCPVCMPEATVTEVTPSPTPATITNADGTVETAYYDTPTGKYYHSLPNCSGMTTSQKVTLAQALAYNQTPCPVCIGSVYWTDGGTYYHTISNCSGMKSAKQSTVAEAQAAGKTACPVCSGGTISTTTSDASAAFWATAKGTYYHLEEHCQGMTGATRVTQAAAEASGKIACPTCIGSTTAENYWSVSGGKYFHTVKDCSGMKNATKVSLATALSRGQTACPVCMSGVKTVTGNTGTTTTKTADSSTTTYYSTENGAYFHSREDCSGMKGATPVTAAQIASRKQTPCPRCIGTAGIYYSTPTGEHYHSKATCSGMKGASIVTLATIKARKQTPCPVCIGGGTSKTSTVTTTSTSTGSGDYWHTQDGKYYHANSTCSGMKGATRTTAAAAQKMGQTACPTCIGSYWHTKDGTYYHTKRDCSGMDGATRTTAAAAKKLGQTACPVCAGGKAPSASTAPAQPTSSGSGDYWHTQEGKYYHAKSTCSGMKGATRTTAAAAEKMGQTPCPDCIGSYWHTKDGTYYHTKRDCSGMDGATRTTAAAAKKLGQTACPVCAGGKKPESTDGSGNGSGSGSGSESDGKVDPDKTTIYVTIEGRYYHTSASCSGMKHAASTTLRWALDHNYSPCPTCKPPKVS